jgi:hypothetical protein
VAEGDELLTHKVGPLPVIVWVGGGAAVVFLLLMISRSRNNNAGNMQTNQVSSLAPTEAEAFGTIEQQQQDVTNALTTLGNNQSYLGGSLSTLTGIVTQQGADNAASFQNLVNGQQQIQQGQASAATNAQNYYNSLFGALGDYYNSLNGSLNGINSGLIGVDQDVRANQMVLSLMPGGQQAFWDWYHSAGIDARNAADMYLYGGTTTTTPPPTPGGSTVLRAGGQQGALSLMPGGQQAFWDSTPAGSTS